MSREEVLAALPGGRPPPAHAGELGQPTQGSKTSAIPDMTMGAIRYRALFGFGGGKLDRIHHVVPKAACEPCRATSSASSPSGTGRPLRGARSPPRCAASR